MAKTGFFNYPQPNHPKGEISIGIEDLYLTRITPPWSRPSTLPANVWRAWVLQQPVAMVCRETLIASLLSLDWQITPRNSKYREELEPTIRHYTKLLVDGGNYPQLGLDYAGLVEWITADLLDTPFGGAAEIGRKGNSPDGRVMWIRPLDSGTLYPTLNGDYPVVQMYMAYDAVAFRNWEISRTFMSPHSFLLKEGWGMAPPEKIYFALELLNRGDKYYANLLLDVPTAGILDLGDMAKDEALEWATAFKSFVQDETVAFRVPVLYEHNNKIEYIPFGKVPNDIMFNQITLKYAALVAAAYGMSLSDIGLQTTSASGETLAGSIRQERRTKKTGFARMKAKLKSFFDRILPEQIEFSFIDYDDELNVALGRARLASSQAFLTFKDMGTFSPQEIRTAAIHDGLFPKSFPDEIPPDAKPAMPADRTIRYVGEKSNDKPKEGGNKEPELVGNKVAPSAGGEGEVRKSLDSVSFKSKTSLLNNSIERIVYDIAPKIYATLSNVSEDEIDLMRSMILESVFSDEDGLELGVALTNLLARKSFGEFTFGKLDAEFDELLEELGISGVDTKSHVTNLKRNIRDGFSEFVGRAIVYTLTNSEHLLSADFESVIQDVQYKIHKSLTEYVSAHVGMEVQKIIADINQGQKEIPEVLRIKSAIKIRHDAPVPLPPVINLPDINVNVPVEAPVINVTVEKSDATPMLMPMSRNEEDMQIIINNPERVDMTNKETLDVMKSLSESIMSARSILTPIVNVNVEPTPVEIVNQIDVDVEPTPVEIINALNPTPVNIENVINVPAPKPKKKEITLTDEKGNTWHGEAK